MIAKQVRIEIQRILGGLVADGVFGPKTRAQFERLATAPDGSEWEPVPKPAPAPPVIPDDGTRVDERSEKNIATLHPDVQPLARALVKAAVAQGINIKITSGTRTYAEQDALYAQGRSKPGNIVTNARAGQSWHNFSVAFDVTLFDGTEPVWESPLYKKVGEIGKSLGLEWGGDWKGSLVDEPHFQFNPRNVSLAEARELHAQGKTVFA